MYSRLCFVLLCVATFAGRLAAADLPAGVRVETYTGWTNCFIVESTDVEVKLVVVPAIGGRIINYSFDRDNIIHEPAGSAGTTLATAKGAFRVGGYQVDLGPEIHGVPRHPGLWHGPYRAEAPRDYTVKVTSEPDPVLGMQIIKEFVLDPSSGDVGLLQTMKNVSPQERSFCLWDRTLVKGGGFAFFPLNKKSRFPAKWAIKRKVGERMIYDGAKPESPMVKVIDGVLIARTEGPATKIGADSDAGWVAYAWRNLLFIKYYPYFPKGDYTDGGNSVEVYWDEEKGELEPLSPEVKLQPNESYSFPEKWTIIELEKDVNTFEDARKLVRKIPAFKF
ncbi:MAG: hypothetical protein AB1705_17495 [Verrucomicrobiota bacterium]